ncbi:hypothetical protein FOCC_FOCC008341 [Frankliniella occidentalis]|nr:hypothetical protein FOCC_FOCC008341 [Frankliniella occidentalis]
MALWPSRVLALLCVVTLVADAVRIIREQGFKDGTCFYHDNRSPYSYHLNTKSATTIYFKCVAYELGCRGRAKLRLGGNFVHSKAHNHAADPDFIQERQFRTRLLAKVRESKWVDYKDILEAERFDNRYSRRVRSRMTLRRLRTVMRNTRLKKYPVIPQTLQELTDLLMNPDNDWLPASVDKKDNIYAGSVNATDGTHCILFMSERMLQFAGEVLLFQADGTFKSRPATPPSSQVFCLITTYKGATIPLGWALMERRTQVAYEAVFALLKRLNPEISPSHVITDFEGPQQTAWRTAFPGVKVQGCFFHLTQAFVKHARKLGLVPYWDAIPELLPYIRRCCAISLLPRNLFSRALELIKRDCLEESIEAAFLLRPFFSYVKTNWINNRQRRQYMSFWECRHRTNNACESHHRSLKRKVGAHRPNVFQFIEALASIEQTAYLDMALLLTEGKQPNRTRRWSSILADRSLMGLNRAITGPRLLRNRDNLIRHFLSRAAELNYGLVNDLARRPVNMRVAQ